MKVNRAWLQKYFDAPLPSVEVLADRLTFRAFEIEEIKGETLDVKVLPDRAGYALSHRGIAYELSAILDLPLKKDPLREVLPTFTSTPELTVTTDPTYVMRHTGALIRGVTVGPSPAWLKEALESVGQRSINNVVDAMNYVMLDMGQPSGGFDVGALQTENGRVKVDIRRAKQGEKITVLTGETYELSDSMFVFTDAVSGELLDIAGIKGGLSSGVNEKTKDLFLSAGNYDPVLIRRASQTLKLFTDASQRFQNAPSPELTAFGMHALLTLIPEVAGGTVVGVVDEYNTQRQQPEVRVTRTQMVERLGRELGAEEITSVFKRLDFKVVQDGDSYRVRAPFERSDISIPEDVTEEVGRIVGYENLPSKTFPRADASTDQMKFRGIERIKDILIGRGFIEISTQSFAKRGLVKLANPLDVDNPYLRPALTPNMEKALKEGKHVQPLVLEPNEKLKLFEIGTVFESNAEHLSLVTSEVVPEVAAEINVDPVMSGNIAEYDLSTVDLDKLGAGYTPSRYELGMFSQFSVYPFVLRDIALWVLNATDVADIQRVITAAAGAFLYRIDLFDTFAKDGRTSYAFRLVFQSREKTLTDQEVNGFMNAITDATKAKGWEVR